MARANLNHNRPGMIGRDDCAFGAMRLLARAYLQKTTFSDDCRQWYRPDDDLPILVGGPFAVMVPAEARNQKADLLRLRATLRRYVLAHVGLAHEQVWWRTTPLRALHTSAVEGLNPRWRSTARLTSSVNLLRDRPRASLRLVKFEPYLAVSVLGANDGWIADWGSEIPARPSLSSL